MSRRNAFSDWQDIKIMDVLQRDSTITIKALGRQIGLTQTPCRDRILHLIAAQYMSGPVMLLNKHKLELNVTAFVMIKMTHQHEMNAQLIADISQMAEVQRFYRTTGTCDYVLQVVARDMTHYSDIFTRIKTHAGDNFHITSNFSLQEFKDTTHLPVF